jgi:hypothetical protein
MIVRVSEGARRAATAFYGRLTIVKLSKTASSEHRNVDRNDAPQLLPMPFALRFAAIFSAPVAMRPRILARRPSP